MMAEPGPLGPPIAAALEVVLERSQYIAREDAGQLKRRSRW